MAASVVAAHNVSRWSTPGGDLVVEVQLWRPAVVRCSEVPHPVISAADASEVDQLFRSARGRNPALFDGPIALARDVQPARAGGLEIFWYPATYRALALRRLGYQISSLFVVVLLPTIEGGVVLARAAKGTAKEGLWQLPGGSVEPPRHDSEGLDVAYLAAEASRELAEETGIYRPAASLRLWAVSRGEHGNVGVSFVVAPVDSPAIDAARHHIARASLRELDSVIMVGDVADLESLEGNCADYVAPHVACFLTEPT